MSDPSARTFSGDFKRFFLRGLVVLLPTVLTLWIVVKAYQFVDGTIAQPINSGTRVALVNLTRVWEPLREVFDPTEEAIQAEIAAVRATGAKPPERSAVVAKLRRDNIYQWWTASWYMDLIGLVIAIIAVYIAGRLLGGFFGRQLYRRLEGFITSLPVFKQVYPYVKQIVDFLFSDEQPMKFNRVVVCEYPRKGIWSVGFLTGDTLKSVADLAGEAVTVFVPSSPTPFTGYTITVPADEVYEVPISVEEAIRFAVSGGVLVPDHQAMKRLESKGVVLPSRQPVAAPAPSEAGAGDDSGKRPEPGSQNRRNAG